MPGLNDLAREYEARRYPPTRRLDLQAEGPGTARERTLRWIQRFAHEQPGADLLLILERGRRVEGRKSPVRRSVEGLLDELTGALLEAWQPFGAGTIAVRVARAPSMFGAPQAPARPPPGEGRTPQTAGAAYVPPEDDIPPELLPLARRAAELRRAREGFSQGVTEVVLRRLWIEAQAMAMADRLTFGEALARMVEREERQVTD